MKTRSIVVLLAVIVVVLECSGVAAAIDPVHVQQGLLSGTVGKSADIRVYRGIPYAAPPVGELRWKPPELPADWKGVRQATEFSNACWQTPYPPAAAIYQAKLPPLSEDCLYLNVWTPAKSDKDHLPVMVWIHGGGFTRGFGGTSSYDGEILARKNVVVVTINYRLGIFGFFAHPALTAESREHASGNYALMDQIAALQWVKRNIAAFGGDPARVTIFGESAGAWAVNALMASPMAKGLFHRAIGESGGLFSPMKTLAEAEKEGEKLAASIVGAAAEGKAEPGQTSAPASVLSALRARPAEELLKAYDAETVRAIVDGWVLPRDVASAFAQGKYNHVPLIVGYNADEGTTLAPQGANLRAAMFVAGVRQRYGAMADEFLKIYPANTDEEAVSSFYSAYRDQVFGWEMRTWARMAARRTRQPVFMYYFSRRPPGPLSNRLRAFHAAEIAYVFGNFVWPFPWQDVDRKLSEAIVNYWAIFAASGIPNGGDLINWPPYKAKSDQLLDFGDKISVRSKVNKAGLDFFDRYYRSLAKSKKAGAVAQPKQ